MGFLARAVAAPRRRAAAFGEAFWPELMASVRSKTGQSVTVDTALQVAGVLACVRVIAEGVAQVPLKVFQKRADGKGRDEATKDPLHWRLYRQPNDWQTSFELRETLVAHAALAGRFVGFKNIVRGEIREILPFAPHQVAIDLDDMKRLRFKLTSERTGETVQLPQQAVWYVKGMSWNGWQALEPVRLAREAIGLSLATEEAHALLHANGTQSAGAWSVENKLDAKQHKELTDWIAANSAGANRFKPLILDRAAKFVQTQMTGVDAQHLETRNHQLYEICRGQRVMPIMIGLADKAATYASAEQMFLAHVVHTLMPWYQRIEETIDVQLIGEEKARGGMYAKFMPNALMRGASKDRAAYYWQRWQMGTINPDEIRALEDENPIEGGGGNVYRVPANTVDASEPPPADETTPPNEGGPPASRARRNVGRVLSGRNERRIRDADGLLNDVLAELDEDPEE